MTDIKLYKQNELYIGIETSPSIWYELRDVFRFRPDGYKYTPKFKYGTWDGYISLIDIRNRRIPQGLIPELMQWAKKCGYSVEFDKDSGQLIRKFDCSAFLDNWSEYVRFEPYDYQLEAVENILKLNKCLVLSPTSSGKSLICALLIKYLLSNTKYRILITVPTTQLVEQLAADFYDYAPDKAKAIIPHKVYGGKEKYSDNRVVISTWQSMLKMPKEYFTQFDVYICDEAHQADGKSISGIINKLEDTSVIRVGLTGTLDGTKCHLMQMKALFGPVIKTLSTKELMERGNITQMDISVEILKYIDKPRIGSDYHAEIDYIVEDQNRLDYVSERALNLPNNTLVLFNFVDKHGKPLYTNTIERNNGRKEIYYLSGETPIEEREEIRQKFATQDNIVLFASFGTFSTGINAPNIHNLILAHPGKARIRTLQSIGRALRKMKNKNKALVIDIADDLKPGNKKKNHSYNHLLKRLEIYESEKFDYTVRTVEIGDGRVCE